MAWSQREREIASRLALMTAAGYIGGVGGITYSNGWKFELSMLNPMSVVGVLVGSIITPWANVVMLAAAVLGAVYTFTRVPLWTCLVWGVLIGVAAAAVRIMWRSG